MPGCKPRPPWLWAMASMVSVVWSLGFPHGHSPRCGGGAGPAQRSRWLWRQLPQMSGKPRPQQRDPYTHTAPAFPVLAGWHVLTQAQQALGTKTTLWPGLRKEWTLGRRGKFLPKSVFMLTVCPSPGHIPSCKSLGLDGGINKTPRSKSGHAQGVGLRKDSCRQESYGAEKGQGSVSCSPQPQAWCPLRSGLTSQGLSLLCKMWGVYGVATCRLPHPPALGGGHMSRSCQSEIQWFVRGGCVIQAGPAKAVPGVFAETIGNSPFLGSAQLVNLQLESTGASGEETVCLRMKLP